MAGKSVATSPTAYEYGMLQDYNKKYPDKALVLQTISNLTAADSFKMVASGQVDSVLCYDGSFDTVNDETGTGLYKTDVVMCESTYFMCLERLRRELAGIGVTGMTVIDVLGCGEQRGARETYRGIPVDVAFVPKVLLDVVVSKVPVEDVVAATRRALYTGHIGDGKIFVYGVAEAVKVRTGEHGCDAVQDIDAL